MHRSLINSACSLLLLFVFSCDEPEETQKVYSKEEYKTILENSNKVKTIREEDDIKNYISRRNWKAEETGTGVYIVKYESGKSSDSLIKAGNGVRVTFTVSLLNGTLCYSTQDTPSKQLEFEVEKAELESGLHEALTHLRKGDKAIILIPSHRAHGLLGDQEKIPALSTVIYDIQILDVLRK
ncbi:MAG: FKBP-type peptidyl-prolyl cis-trans isomerase [Flavobacteriales bacterium]